MQVHEVRFLGMHCIEVSNGTLSLRFTKDVGPRVISLQLPGSPNMFAEFAEETMDRPGRGEFRFYGGHRLWRAPEDPALTYLPDNDPVDIQMMENGVRVAQKAEAETGIEKQLTLRFESDPHKVVVDHTFTNRGSGSVRCALWATTMFKPGGVAILPQSVMGERQSDLLPNRSIVLWPYSDVGSPCLSLGNERILVRAEMREGRLKIGYPNSRGWLAYWRDRTLFVKRADYVKGAEYCDLGSSSECYCGTKFIELETIGPIGVISPGESAHHRETWEVYPEVLWNEDIAPLARSIDSGAFSF